MKSTNNIVIVTGGSIDTGFLSDYLKTYKDLYIIGVDKGLISLRELGITPDLIVGDFDSAGEEIKRMYEGLPQTICLQPEKDYTDTHVALMKALELTPKTITMLGATGSRIDHMMANIGLLKFCAKAGVDAYIMDGNNRIRMIDKHCRIEKDKAYGKYISCIPFSDTVTGVTLKGFKYPLDNATMIKENSIGISNELREEDGHISIDKGYLLVMETKD